MGLKTPVLIIMLSTYFFFSSRAYGIEPEKMNLIVGESRALRIEKAFRVHVTRKGIIHLVHEHDDTWQMTALRSGMVAIEVKASEQLSKTIYVQVKPSSATPRKSDISNYVPRDLCSKNEFSQSHQYEIRTTVEMADSSQATTTGPGLSAKVGWTPSTTENIISFEANPQISNSKRQILGDPVITTLPCVDVEIRAGGEDQADIKSDSNVITSSWKQHGLDINMRIIPLSATKVRIPYRVSLRVPSRKQGSYALSEARASLDLPIGQRKLASVINLSSSNAEQKSLYFISNIPIIGPIIAGKSDSAMSSKLFVWLQIEHADTKPNM